MRFPQRFPPARANHNAEHNRKEACPRAPGALLAAGPYCTPEEKMAFTLSSRAAGFTTVSVKQSRVTRAGRAASMTVYAAKKEAVVVLTGTAGVSGTVMFSQEDDGEATFLFRVRQGASRRGGRGPHLRLHVQHLRREHNTELLSCLRVLTCSGAPSLGTRRDHRQGQDLWARGRQARMCVCSSTGVSPWPVVPSRSHCRAERRSETAAVHIHEFGDTTNGCMSTGASPRWFIPYRFRQRKKPRPAQWQLEARRDTLTHIIRDLDGGGHAGIAS